LDANTSTTSRTVLKATSVLPNTNNWHEVGDHKLDHDSVRFASTTQYMVVDKLGVPSPRRRGAFLVNLQ